MPAPARQAVHRGVRYPQLLRAEPTRWWRPLLGLLFAALSMVVGSVGVVLAAVAAAALLGDRGTEDELTQDALSPDTWLGLLANNLVIAVMVPAAVLAVLVVHRAPAWRLASVLDRARWALLGRFVVLALLVVLVSFGVSFVLPGEGSEIEVPAGGTLVALLAVILLTTPLQAAAEEVGFRGYLSQAVASWSRTPAVGTIVAAAVSGFLFALAHGTQDLALFGDRLAFGLTASWLAWRTGGLEAPVALHVANNLVSLAFTAATGSLEDSLTASTLDWSYAVLDVATMVAYALIVHRLCTRWGVVTHAPEPALPDGSVLSGPEGVGYPGSRPPTPPPAGGENPWGMG